MYKLLPILLFAVIFSQSKVNKNLFLLSDPKMQAFQSMLTEKQDTNYVPTSYSEYIDYKKQVLQEEINIKVNGLIASSFFIETELTILDTAYCSNRSVCLSEKYSNMIADTTDMNLLLNSNNKPNTPDSNYLNQEGKCDRGYVDDCSDDGDCCPESWIGDGFADCEDQAWGCDLTCYGNDDGDCDGYSADDRGGESSEACTDCEYDFTPYGSECCDTAWDEYGIDCTTLERYYNWDCSGCNCPGDHSGNDGDDCDVGYVDDCSGDGDCCPEVWIGDGRPDCEHQPYGCDLSCYNNDYGDCHFLKSKTVRDYSNQGMNIDLIYNEVINKNTSIPMFNAVNSQIEFGIITGKLKVNVYHDNNVRLESFENSVRDLIKSTHPSLPNCDDCISFTSIDMDSLREVNEPIKNTISLNRDDIYDNSWAVIIGIDKYKYSDQLNYAVKDAEAVKEMLISKFEFPEDNIKYLTDEEATLSNIKLALDDIATLAGEDDRILVFYSGHGETIPTKDDSEKGYIIPYEGRQNKAYATGLAMDEILTTSQLSNAKHMLFLMDACYSGLMTQQYKGIAKPTEEGYLTKVANESSRQIITAGGRDQQVIERDEWQHSAFTKNLLEGLESWGADYNKDGCITADELSTYLREHVTEDSDFQQTPQDGRFRNSGGGEFVFFGTGDPKTEAEISLIKEKKDENLKEELFDSYEYDKELIQEFKEHKRQNIISKLANNPPKSIHSFFLNGYQYNKSFLNSNKEWSVSLLGLNELVYTFAVGIKNFIKEERKGLYWGYNLLLLGKLKERGHLHPLPRVYVGNKGLLPSLEFGYRLRWISSIRYGISGTKKGRRKMRPFYITAKLNLYPLKDELFDLPINELYKNIVFSPSVGMEAPINWWSKNIK